MKRDHDSRQAILGRVVTHIVPLLGLARYLRASLPIAFWMASAGLVHGQITVFDRDFLWEAQARQVNPLGVEEYAFDENWPGRANWSGSLTPIGEDARWMLRNGNPDILMVVANVGPRRASWASSPDLRKIFRVIPGANIVDGSKAPRTSGARLDVGHTTRWAFGRPIRGLFTYFSSQDTHATVTMRLQPGNRLVGVFTSTSNRGQGHGFISTIDITAVDFFYSGPDLEGGRYAIIGEFAGLTANQVGLGPVPAYGGTVIADFAILRP